MHTKTIAELVGYLRNKKISSRELTQLYLDRIKKYNEVLKNICMESNIPFLEMLDIIDIKDLPDGLHPDSTGHEKMFQRIKEFILSNNILD